MSVISLLIVEPHRLPSFEEVRDEAVRRGNKIDLIHPVDLRSHTGFLPVRVDDRETGFEYYFEPTPEKGLPADARQFGSYCIVTRTGSDFEEGRASLIFLRVVARLTSGAYAYPDDDLLIPPDEVAPYLDQQIEEFGRYIK